MKHTKQVLALLLTATMLLSTLSGCGGKKESDSGSSNKYMYKASYYDLSDEIQSVNTCCYSNGLMYIVGFANTDGTAQPKTASSTSVGGIADSSMGTAEPESTVSMPFLYSVKLDGTGLAKLPGYQAPVVPDGMEGNGSINSMFLDKDGNLWVMESVSTYSFDLPADFDKNTGDKWSYYKEGETKTVFRQLSSDGSEKQVYDLSKILEQNTNNYISSVQMDDAGNFYFSDGMSSIFVADAQGNILFTLTEDNQSGTLIKQKDGTVGVISYKEGRMLMPIDVASKAFGKGVELPQQAYNLFPGTDNYEFFYSTDSTIYGCKKDGTQEKLTTWLSCDVDSNNLYGTNIVSEEEITAVMQDEEGKTQLVVLNRTENTPDNQKTVLTMAVMYLDYNVRGAILKFNRSNDKYRIEVNDYSDYNTDKDYTAGLTKLNTEILSGKVPDLLAVDSMPLRQYGAKGILADLLPLIEADTELGGKDALVQPVLNAMLQDGKLYQVAPSFTLSTVAVRREAVGEDATGWTVDEVTAALQKMPEGAQVFEKYTTQADLLQTACVWNMENFINWDTGECFFDSADFAKLLEFSKLAPKEYTDSGEYTPADTTYARLESGKQLASTVWANDFTSLQVQEIYFGGRAAFVGYPSESRDGNAFSVSGGLAMSSKCKDKDGAWQFLRTFLTAKYQEENVYGFGTNQEAFDKLKKEAMTKDMYKDENGVEHENPKTTWGDGYKEVQIMAMTQEEADRYINLINATSKLQEYDQSILKIIMDESQAFIEGQKSAADVAAVIQSRVKLYVNEQK